MCPLMLCHAIFNLGLPGEPAASCGGGVPSNSIVEMRQGDNAAVMISDHRSRYRRRSASFPYPPTPPAVRRLY